MSNETALPIVKLVITIVDRGKGNRVVELAKLEHLYFHYVFPGCGTANSTILDYFGLGETKKDIVMTFAPENVVAHLMNMTAESLQMLNPGNGIMFSLPLTSVSSYVAQILGKQAIISNKYEVEKMENQGKFDLIVTLVRHGDSDVVYDAAKAAGATGGTVLNARRMGYEDAEKISENSVQPEKEIIAILSEKSKRPEIMQAISRAAGITTESQGILFSLPVENIVGISSFNHTEEK